MSAKSIYLRTYQEMESGPFLWGPECYSFQTLSAPLKIPLSAIPLATAAKWPPQLVYGTTSRIAKKYAFLRDSLFLSVDSLLAEFYYFKINFRETFFRNSNFEDLNVVTKWNCDLPVQIERECKLIFNFFLAQDVVFILYWRKVKRKM